MRKKDFKGKVEKKSLSKCKSVCKTYDLIQSAYADVLEESEDIVEIRCNVVLDGEETKDYMSDFVCTKKNGELLVRECVYRKHLAKPKTAQLLDESRNYWLKRGVTDWGIVVDEVNEEER